MSIKEGMNRLGRFLRGDGADGTSSEIDFEKGDFWRTALGIHTRSFAQSEMEGSVYPKKVSRIPALLDFRYPDSSVQYIHELVECGMLDQIPVDNTSRFHTSRLNYELPHVIVIGLYCLHRERGFTHEETAVKLQDLLQGSSLQTYLGPVKPDFRYLFLKDRNAIFSDKSIWKNFPLEPKVEEHQERSRVIQRPVAKASSDSKARRVGQPEKPKVRRPIAVSIEAKQTANAIERVLNAIPVSDEEQLKEFISIDEREIMKMFERIPDDFDEFSFNRAQQISPHVINAVIFIATANERALVMLESRLSIIENRRVRLGLRLCLAYMQQYPHIKNFAELIQAIEKQIKKNPAAYWEQ